MALVLRNSTIKTKFTTRFLASLSKIKRVDTVNNQVHFSAAQETQKRSQRIKIAAYSSMARAAGSRRAWSRALLFKLRNRTRIRRFSRVEKKRGMNKAKMLRNLVPGGNKMDICRLLEETSHYIKCLSTQVEVMQSIVDRCSM